MSDNATVYRLARRLRVLRGCSADRFPCAFCHWPEDKITPECDETGCIYIVEELLKLIKES